jgi:TolB-like protein
MNITTEIHMRGYHMIRKGEYMRVNLGRSRAAVAAHGALAAALVLAWGVIAPRDAGAQQDRRPTVAVMYFNNGAMLQNADYEPLRKGIADVLITELMANEGIRVVERDHLHALLEEQNLDSTSRVDQATAVQIGKILGVHHMIFGGFIVDQKGRMRLDARSVNVETSRIEYVATVSDKADNLFGMISELAEKMNKGLKLPPMPTRARQTTSDGGQPGQWRNLILYARAMDAQDSRNPREAVTLYKEFLAASPPGVLTAQRTLAEQRIERLQSGS